MIDVFITAAVMIIAIILYFKWLGPDERAISYMLVCALIVIVLFLAAVGGGSLLVFFAVRGIRAFFFGQ